MALSAGSIMRRPLRWPWLNLDPDNVLAPAIDVRVDVTETKAEVPGHQHRKGQLVFALGGGVTCRVLVGQSRDRRDVTNADFTGVFGNIRAGPSAALKGAPTWRASR